MKAKSYLLLMSLPDSKDRIIGHSQIERKPIDQVIKEHEAVGFHDIRCLGVVQAKACERTAIDLHYVKEGVVREEAAA